MDYFKSYPDDATGLADQIRRGQTTSQELVHQAIDKAKAINPKLNAVTRLFEDYAQDLTQKDHRQTLFAGLPTLMKDLGHNIKGMPATSGARLLKDQIAPVTSNFSQSVMATGLIPIGQSNVPEFGLKFISDSDYYGPVHNPINPSYNAGGSSGGAAAAVQAGIVPLATASDGGGSIRIPASFSGLVGLKPSRVRTATGPRKWRSWGGAPVGFMMTKSIRDTAQLLLTLQSNLKPMPFQTLPIPKAHIEEAIRAVKGLRIAYSTQSPVGSDVSPEAIEAVENTVRFLRDQGFQVEAADPKIDGQELVRGYYQMNGAEMAASFLGIEQQIKRKIKREDVEIQTWTMAQYGKTIPAYRYSQIFDTWDQAAEIMDDFHQTYDILIQPSTAQAAPRVDDKLYTPSDYEHMLRAEELSESDLADLVYQVFKKGLLASPFAMVYNLTGQPAISLPLHTCQDGLPLGVQLVANKGEEALLIGLSAYLEREDRFHYYPDLI